MSVAIPSVAIRAAAPAEMPAARALFEAYHAWFAAAIGGSLCFQGFEAELAGLPGAYADPGGVILLAEGAEGPLGCVAVKPLDAPGACEMKRLFVAEAGRGTGLGRALAEAALAWGRAAGYAEMRLDTLERMTAALALYRALGFAPTAPYVANPLPDVVYLARAL